VIVAGEKEMPRRKFSRKKKTTLKINIKNNKPTCIKRIGAAELSGPISKENGTSSEKEKDRKRSKRRIRKSLRKRKETCVLVGPKKGFFVGRGRT